ncbi:hypothetical protein RJ639_013727 [Escallonia herrerae]|uniref:Uncharacterized protein n=1 Tax=Escallonia herrerae TaxID=1293975 RepID=A0AA88VG60_9ASTE|nr:hypothetical protein RJ639_013727 [Escallonia herrerae]
MSAEELLIRGELEMDVERDLEEEIKDGIYHLVLRLHRLFLHQKERNGRKLLEQDAGNQQRAKGKTLTEVNINIRMEGGTKIEIKEIKKEAMENGRPRSSRSANLQSMIVPNAKKFDWAKTLRSGPSPTTIFMKNNNLHGSKFFKNDRGEQDNMELDNARKHFPASLGQRKGAAAMDAEKRLLLKPEWKW